MAIALRALYQLLKNWKHVALLIGLIFSVGFNFTLMVREVNDSILSHWWLITLGFLVILAREFIRNFFELKRTEKLIGERAK